MVSGKAGYDCELSGHGKAKCSTRDVRCCLGGVMVGDVRPRFSLALSCAEWVRWCFVMWSIFLSRVGKVELRLVLSRSGQVSWGPVRIRYGGISFGPVSPGYA
jgi:hypothetical protein